MDIALFLDFDGTLAEIAPRPDAVQVEPGLVETLERLRGRLDGALAIVTGRPVSVIDGFLAPARLDAAGLHGVERRIAGAISGGRAEDHPDLRRQVERLHAESAALANVLIEDKGASVAVHWRLASPDDAGRAEALVKAAAETLGGAYRLQLGKAVGEIVPAQATKAHAIRAFMEQAPYAGRIPVFLGDDRTDEIAFASVTEDGGVAVRVGDGETAASRRLPDPAAVRALLRAWAEGGAIDPEALPPA
ncbi:trehalose-phosphatase [Methylobacterium mesophilicum SR1.6/6]|uniref:Trehalose 6-phosphate phosphatase n=1 Tax=Methylobacterium mesophilicum SR1.6/6 TaxID=908290 RepID=A0A6B9FP00_9HYPH|nr:trehalose-phosphatase [Methylobacterium mesophilicum]QGY02708.1 trehalose-phosphatase [Methylobacterium mesophilicum SR1.6/6]